MGEKKLATSGEGVLKVLASLSPGSPAPEDGEPETPEPEGWGEPDEPDDWI